MVNNSSTNKGQEGRDTEVKRGDSGAYWKRIGHCAHTLRHMIKPLVPIVDVFSNPNNSFAKYANDVEECFGMENTKIWRFLANGASLWSRFISAIYGIRGALDNSSSYSRRSPWLDIVNEVRKLASKGIDILSLVKKKVGNGEATSFWNDVWLGLLRSGIEEEQLLLLISNTSSVILPNISDRWSWLLDPSGDFSVKSTREFIDDSMLPKTDVPTRWVKSIPIKINIFAWRVSLDKLCPLG
ncbi:hypothetical protein Tco_1087561 [Tanacetum coccineum]